MYELNLDRGCDVYESTKYTLAWTSGCRPMLFSEKGIVTTPENTWAGGSQYGEEKRICTLLDIRALETSSDEGYFR